MPNWARLPGENPLGYQCCTNDSNPNFNVIKISFKGSTYMVLKYDSLVPQIVVNFSIKRAGMSEVGRYCSSAVSNKVMHSLNGNISSKNLKFCHLNIRGDLKGKKNEICTIIERNSPHILGLSETNQSHLDDIDYEDTMYTFVPGYTYCKNYTRVGALVRKGLKFKVRKDIMEKLSIPCVWIELSLKGKKVTVINCYREHRMVGFPNNELTKSGQAQMERWGNFVHYWERSVVDDDETWLLGDVNLDPGHKATNGPQHYYTRRMLGMIDDRIAARGVGQLVSGDTWTSGDGRSSSLIDHIYTNANNYTSVSNARNSGSDHNMIGVIRRGEEKFLRVQYRRSRNMSNFSKSDFLFILNNLDLDPILSVPSPETQVQMLTAALEVAADITCPYVNFTVKRNHTKWLTPDLKEIMEARDSWFKEYRATRDADAHANYRRLRNRVNTELKKAKTRFYKNATNSITDPEEVWAKLNETSGRNMGFSEPITIVQDGKEINNPKEIAQIFNVFYQNKVKNIIDNLPTATEPPVRGPKPGVIFKFHKVGVKEVRKHIYSLNNSRATGHDGISNVLIKAGIIVIAPILTRIINNCIRTSSFPETWKVGKVAVVYKNKGEKTNPNSYRPVTLLCAMSKVIEKVMFKQILHYFQSNGMMDPRQYGFLPGRSCAHAVLDYLTTVLSGKEEPCMNKINGLLIDLSAAFDTVGHTVLLSKLKKYGFSEPALTLMESYLSDRCVYTEVENQRSDVLIQDRYSVPQGSVLGPLLYLIYVISLRDLDNNTRITYADDVTAVIRANSKEELKALTDQAMEKLIDFFTGSGLKLNNDKTELISHTGSPAEVKINALGDLQQSSASARLLGIIVDQNLNFHSHIEKLIREVEHRLWLFKKVSKVANTRCRLLYAHGLLFSKFIYGIQCYAGTDLTHLEKVRVAYDKCVRATYGKNPKNVSTATMRKELRLLSFHQLVVAMDMGLYRDILIRRAPDSLHSYLSTARTDSRQGTRGLMKVNVIPKTSKFHRSFLFRATSTWNELPNEFRDLSVSKTSFQDNIKRFLLGDFNGPGSSEPAPLPRSNSTPNQHQTTQLNLSFQLVYGRN